MIYQNLLTNVQTVYLYTITYCTLNDLQSTKKDAAALILPPQFSTAFSISSLGIFGKSSHKSGAEHCGLRLHS